MTAPIARGVAKAVDAGNTWQVSIAVTTAPSVVGQWTQRRTKGGGPIDQLAVTTLHGHNATPSPDEHDDAGTEARPACAA